MFRKPIVTLIFFIRALSIVHALPAESRLEAVDQALALGDRYARSGAFDPAITEYKRVLFFDEDNRLASTVHSRIASCYRSQHRWNEAFFHLRRSIQVASSLKEIEDREFELITVLLASGRDSEAELRLLRLRDFPEIDRKRVSLHLCVTYVYRGRWEDAAAELDQAFPDAEIVEPWRRAELERLKRLLAEALSSRRKSPSTALLLSTIVPGTGQLYAGDPWDALNAFALNTGLATLIFTAMKHEYYLEAALLFVYPFRRYYLGNRDNARIAAERSNRVKDLQFRDRIVDQILSLQEAE
jgi:tetratricopeptide (TPR) repeat protein